jgi:hypothetical protein
VTNLVYAVSCEARVTPSGSPQEWNDFATAKLLRGATKTNEKAVRQLGRPSLSRENSSNGAQKRPSELSGEILLGIERQCQGFFGE